ncbi:MAG: 50S ribosomal protein L22 [Candidatus Sericytochromatia bacterium]|nr:50S ribosomal protein L22 [Candidatus Sericytochromatia bacterium]
MAVTRTARPTRKERNQLESDRARAVANYVRMSPRKLRRVVDLVRGKAGMEAITLLRFMPYAAARVVEKVVASAMANAENNKGLDASRLVIGTAFVDGSVTLKRVQPRAQGRAYPIKKRSSHVTIVVVQK